VNPSLLDGKKVVGSEGYILGEVDGVDVDLGSWQTKVFYVSLSDEAIAEFGLKKPFLSKITVCLSTKLVKAVGQVITLKIPIRNLEDISENKDLERLIKLKGKRVIGAKGYAVGEVEGLDLDLKNWRIRGLQVGLTDEATNKFGFKRPFLSKVIVVIPSQIVGTVGNFITLDESIENLEALTECIKSCHKKRT
jgi:sporulation protein YlmC with PRC-barrel domain